MRKASKELNCENMLILTWDHQGKVDGIECEPVWHWLVTKKSERGTRDTSFEDKETFL
ncbi:MAG: hypothetical protein QXX17_06245 [Conexivisphaerales archaeon]